MPIELSPQKQHEIYQFIQTIFTDFPFFETLVSKQLQQAIQDIHTQTVIIDMKTTRKIIDRYYNANLFQTENEKLLLTQIQLILKTTYVYILSQMEEMQASLYKNREEFLVEYPEFVSLVGGGGTAGGVGGGTGTGSGSGSGGEEKEDETTGNEEELDYLLKYCNYMKVALQIIPPRFNKQLLMKIASRLEGSGMEYITGGGQRPSVTRRCLIYEKEGKVEKINKVKHHNTTTQQKQKKRGRKRQNPYQEPTMMTVARKRSRNYVPMKDVKLIELSSVEVNRLASAPDDPFPIPVTSTIPTTPPPNTVSYTMEQGISPDFTAALDLHNDSSNLSQVSDFDFELGVADDINQIEDDSGLLL